MLVSSCPDVLVPLSRLDGLVVSLYILVDATLCAADSGLIQKLLKLVGLCASPCYRHLALLAPLRVSRSTEYGAQIAAAQIAAGELEVCRPSSALRGMAGLFGPVSQRESVVVMVLFYHHGKRLLTGSLSTRCTRDGQGIVCSAFFPSQSQEQ